MANIAFAEGTVNGPVDAGGGPYRRVQTQPIGYKAVTAHFTVPTIFLPNSHDARSTPTFYVGGGSTNGNVEVDAGMNYEPTIKNGVPPGWTAYVRVARGPNPGSVGANGWRSNATTNPNVTSYDLTWIVNPDNTGYLLIQANGADVQPGNNGRIDASAGNQIFNNQTWIYVKRVLGVSQGAGLSRGSYEEDGTYMRGCIVSNAQVATNILPTINWVNWSTIVDNIDQAITGYSPSGKDKHIGHTNRNAIGARYIVDFPGLTDAQRNAIFASRYDTEAVDINLEKHIQAHGTLIVPHHP